LLASGAAVVATGAGAAIATISRSRQHPVVYGPDDTLWIMGIEVCLDSRDPRYFQDWDWIPPPRESLPIALAQVRRFIDEVQEPVERLDLLHMIGLTGRIESPYGNIAGTYRKKYKAIFASTLKRTGRITDFGVHQTLHHEFSSLLIHRGLLPYKEWKQVTGDVEYTHDMRAAVNLRNAGPAEWKQGFLTVYATSNPENDLNTFAGWLAAYPEHLLFDLGVEYPKIGAKARLLLKWYRELGIKIRDLDEQETTNANHNP